MDGFEEFFYLSFQNVVFFGRDVQGSDLTELKSKSVIPVSLTQFDLVPVTLSSSMSLSFYCFAI